jgi:hypothetical protein
LMAGKGCCQPQTDNRCPTVLMAGGLCLSTAVAAQRRDSRGIAVHLRVEVVWPSAAGVSTMPLMRERKTSSTSALMSQLPPAAAQN